MSSTVVLVVLQSVVPDPTAVWPALLAVLASGAVGMSIRQVIDIFGDDGDDEGDGVADGALMTEEGGDGDDDLGGLGGLEGDDEFGDFGDDEFGDMEEGGAADTDELEHRLDELETEVGSLSSTVNTVRNENEQISETVDDVEENVRKLLDIYEMVTRGVNPFADDIDAGMGGGMDGESFGLFDDGETDDDGDDEIDEEIANADAEGFFDEDLADGNDAAPEGDVGDVMGNTMGGDTGGEAFEDDGGTFDDAALDDMDDGDVFEDEFETGENTDMSESSAETESGDEGGKSFAELKDEYESGDAEWADEEDADAEEKDTVAAEPETDDLDDGGDDFADDDLFDEVIEEGDDDALETGADAETGTGVTDDAETETETDGTSPDSDTEPAPAPEPTANGTTEAETETAAGADTAGTTAEADGASEEATGRPYLRTLPAGVATDLIVLEWLEYLVGEVGIRETAKAIDYYETIDWIDESVGEDLQDYLRGFEDVDKGDGGLTIDHHTRSLRYISQLDDDAAESGALSMLLDGGRGGGLDGIQR